ncbi:YhgE/Pip domain-containing protein [Radiobacillus sp. PE A8.2]|uniref:YhgE/Pip domain-containing protein n=1 Tax=Radiobacillus sp. PE A8.2 TaxID=3380349 RepID=UPI00388E4E0D
MRKKLLVLLAFMLLLPSYPIQAASGGSTSADDPVQTSGEVTSKDEVIYATLSATGAKKNIYVVNIFDVTKAGTIVDYGAYSDVENLTNLTEIEQEGNKVQIDAPEGDFYYQGNMQDKSIPWDISVAYQLDGKAVAPEDLLGEDGQFEMNIHTSANGNVNNAFYNNYLLQISLTLDADVFENVTAGDASIANAGANKQVTFTVMPEKEGNFTLNANVKGFEMQGMEISGVPSSMAIDSLDTEEMTNEIETLSDAISSINSGVSDLKNGASQLNDGVNELQNGSKSFQNGIAELDSNSSSLIDASTTIETSLTTISNSLNEGDMDVNLDELKQITDVLPEIADGLNETADWLSELEENYGDALKELDDTMESIPEADISEEIDELYKSIDDEEKRKTIDQLVESYNLAIIAKENYARVIEAFHTLEQHLDDMNGSITSLQDTLTSISSSLKAFEDMNVAGQITQLQEGMSTLASNYGEFHKGLEGYMGGVSELSSNYGELHSGLVQVSDGTSDLESGVGELHEGTNELNENTKNMPEEIKQEIDTMMDEYDKSDFEPVSFVSEQNKQVNNVQFVIKTESITKDEEDTATEESGEKKGFWARLMALFSWL